MPNKPPTSQSTFDAENSKRSWVITVGFHVAVLLLGFFATCSPVEPPEELTEIQWGGGGGIPGLDAPVGETPKGDPDGGNREADPTERNTETNPSTEQTPTSQERPVTRDDPNALPSSREQTSTQENNAKPTETTSDNSSNAGTNNSEKPQGSADGTGEKPTGGSGGSSVGVGNGSIGRCWQRSPSAVASGQTTTQSGTVTVSITVKPDGRVQVEGTSGTASLAGRARTLASQARACVDLEAQDVRTSLTYRFVAN